MLHGLDAEIFHDFLPMKMNEHEEASALNIVIHKYNLSFTKTFERMIIFLET